MTRHQSILALTEKETEKQWRIISRLAEPLLRPEHEYREGYVPMQSIPRA